ncbi:3-carboxy-cis,cis-muconate cycloisomerase [Hoeflea sp. YIM 152468]|uniref:3-carboxy-cis,cis-muconate cycloisomerase n=1 Tax=Hoeflea sp. YIM 152468 TaxID=3031759 RepID=UPI0023DB8F1C|nr:3-carboxy-cis,cis-muconate cycloisomerase [Hoeflea sp. YIM 152468]MDF1607666.1 3-carboxy-cis,cis-muconate cycloisomerase [Hoeflea sp. YIM 152468]
MQTGGYGWTSRLFTDGEIAKQFSDAAMFARFASFEKALIHALAEAGLIEPADAERLVGQIAGFEPDPEAIATAVVRDGLPVPDYVRQLRAHVSGPGSSLLHHGATSQDLIDTATVQALARISAILGDRLDDLLALLDSLAARDGSNPLMAITRMQPALGFSTQDRLAAWRRPLETLRDQLPALRHRSGLLQFGGAIGTLQALGDRRESVARSLAKQLNLHWPGHSWHSARDPITAHATWMGDLSGALGKIGQDVALMALRGPQDIRLSDAGASSAMPHKQNPVTAERLVTLARYNATLVSGMHHAQIHEMERSGAAWMLEWMILPQMCETTGASLAAARALFKSIDRMGEPS